MAQYTPECDTDPESKDCKLVGEQVYHVAGYAKGILFKIEALLDEFTLYFK